MSDTRRTKKKTEATPPPASANPEAEAALLGILFAERHLFHEVSDRLRPADFVSERNQSIWSGMAALVGSGKPIIRAVLLAEIGETSSVDDEIDLAGYLRALEAGGQKHEPKSLGEFADAIKSASIARDLAAYGTWVTEELSKVRVTNWEEKLDEAKVRLAIIGTDKAEDASNIGAMSEAVVADTQKVRNKEKPPGLKTGLKFIDSLVGSLKAGQLIIVGGPPGSGKSSLIAQILYTIALANEPSHLFSPEMVGDELAARMLSALTSVSGDKITEGDVTDEQLAGLVDASRSMRDIPFFIDDRSRPTVSTLTSRASRSIAKHGTKIFATDHLRKVVAEVKGEERERLEQVVSGHKDMAKRLGVPWILGAHTQRPDMSYIKTAKDIRRPNMHSLYGASAIENEADIVIFVHRPEMILLDCKPAPNAKHHDEWQNDLLKCQGKAEIILAKRRGGKGRGIRQCRYDAARTWFVEKEEDSPPAYTGEAPT